MGYRLPRSRSITFPGHFLLSRQVVMEPPKPLPITIASNFSLMEDPTVVRQNSGPTLHRVQLSDVVVKYDAAVRSLLLDKSKICSQPHAWLQGIAYKSHSVNLLRLLFFCSADNRVSP